MKMKTKVHVIGQDAMKSWWAGDARVDPYMTNIRIALDRSGLTGDKRTDVYNRAYEAIYQAIIDADNNFIDGRGRD